MLIHYGWIGPGQPEYVEKAVSRAKERSPGCDVVLHTNEADVPERWRDSMDRFKLPPTMRSDVLRHAVLMKYGGLWLDADVSVIVNPQEWTKGWTKYTAVYLHDIAPLIGTDVIYVPQSWSGWPMVESYIDGFFGSLAAKKQADILALAHWMVSRLSDRQPGLFSILRPRGHFPHLFAPLTADSVVARRFDPDSREVKLAYPERMGPALPEETDHRGGPGTELSLLLKKWFGIEPSPTCKCRTMARKMDKRGPEWCLAEEGMAEIVGVMREEHGKREKSLLPWSETVARQLVRIACRRAK